MATAYLLTFGTFGTHHHGDARGSYLRRFGAMGPNEVAVRASVARMKEEAFVLGAREREVVLQAIVAHAEYREWPLRSAHVRTEHVHLVLRIPPDVSPKRVVADFKAYATRALRALGVMRNAYWARGGHCEFLWTEDAMDRASDYVFDRLGTPMARYSRGDT